MRLRFDKVSRPVQIDDGDRVLSPFRSVFRFWPFAETADSLDEEPVITVKRDGDGYRLFAPWRAKPPRYSDPVNLACGLAVNVNRAMLEEHTDNLCLHGAGVEIGGRLVVLPNYYRAGKSALTVCLAAAGARVFSDDILPLLPDGSGMALGVSPRLRLPLPETLGKRTLRFIESRRGAANKQYLYVEHVNEEQAPLGATAPFGGFVLLNRRESGAARLEPATDSEVLKQVVLRNFARQLSVEHSLDRLHALVAAAACHKLTYAQGDEAADLLMERFSEPDVAASQPATPPVPPVAGSDPPPPSPAQRRHARRKPGIGERVVGNELFLVDGAGQTIYHLNAVGAGLWRLMDGSCGADEAAAILRQAFPDVDRQVIERDIAALTADLLRRGLLQRDSDSTTEPGD